MKTITVLQPWAHLVIHGPKRIENRNWPTKFRGPLLIHAGKSTARLGDYAPTPDGMTFGAIIGAVLVVDCVPLASVQGQPFAEGAWCWLLDAPTACDPIPATGNLSLWQFPDELLPTEFLARCRELQPLPAAAAR